MNEYVLYQPCITSWSIVLFHPTYLSFSQRLINYGGDSGSNYDPFANQSTSRRGTALLTVWPTHTCARTDACAHAIVAVISRRGFFFFPCSLWDHGKVFGHSDGATPGTVLVGRFVCCQHFGPEWNVSTAKRWITMEFGTANRGSRRIINGLYCSTCSLLSQTATNALISKDTLDFSCRPLFGHDFHCLR